MESKVEELTHGHLKQRNPTKQAQTSSKDSILMTLPAELITEILLRLSVKPLLKFRSVSKSWLVLITSPEFINTHLSISANNKDCTHHRLLLTQVTKCVKDCSFSSLLTDSVTETFELDDPLKDRPDNIRVVGSVNGLICLVTTKPVTTKPVSLFLWNPSIRKHKNLPFCGRGVSFQGTYYGFGFGYDEFHDDYKVVCMIYAARGRWLNCVEVKIYSLKSDSWRSMGDFSDIPGFFEMCSCVNGKLHWAHSVDIVCPNWNIVSIDLADEKWGKVEAPCFGENETLLVLGVLGSDLSALSHHYLSSRIDVWVMKEYGVKDSWTKMHSINHGKIYLSRNIPRTIFMSNKGEILIVVHQLSYYTVQWMNHSNIQGLLTFMTVMRLTSSLKA